MAGKNYPGWAYLLAGLLIGLFIAFLVYLQSQPSMDKSSVANKEAELTKSDKLPKFEFYKILPELEVVVSDTNILSNDKPAPNKEPTKTTNRDEKLVLQVGSFNDARQAERMKASLALLGLQATVQRVSVDGTYWHRVRLGPYHNRQRLTADNRQLRNHGIQAITLQLKD